MSDELGASKRTVLDRAFDVLDCFAGGAEIGVAGICERTRLPPATVHRMLAALVVWGGVERLGHGRYRLGARMWRLGIGAPQVRMLREMAQPYLVDLHVATRGTVYLGVQDGSDAVFSDRITRVKPSAESARATRRVPLERTGGGRVLLAYSQAAWDDLRARAEQDAKRRAAVLRLGTELAKIRHCGVAISYNDGFPGRTSVAAPVFGHDGLVSASIALAFPESRIPQPQTVVPRLLSTARAMSADLARAGFR